jgi:D-inositol-3-phosphate glycosyltransferase
MLRAMRILFVLENYYPFIGGAEVLFKNLCEGLAERGNDVRVITTLIPGTPEKETINKVNIIRVRTPRKASRYWFTFLAVPLSVRLAGQADIVHTTTYNGALPALIAAIVKHKKCVITVHEIIGRRWNEMPDMSAISAWLHRLLEFIIARLPFDRYVAVSHYTADCLNKLNMNMRKILVIYNGIDYVLFDPSRSDRDTVRENLNICNRFAYLYYGRPGVSKGVEYLVQAVSLISEKITNSRLILLIAHEPSDRYENVRGLISKLGVQDRIILIDPVPRDQLPSYIASADCVVVPSLSEGFGFSAAEACAMGVPVVASDVASLPEVVSGEYVLVEPKSPQAIALGVEAVYNKKVTCSERKIFRWSDCIDQYEKLYNYYLDTSH